MTQKSWHLDRRTLLRGAGVACAVPALEGMRFPGAPRAEAPRRLCFVSFPNGAGMPNPADAEWGRWHWFPKRDGDAAVTRGLEFHDTLAPLTPFKDQLAFHGGLSHPLSRNLLGHLAGDTWLTAGDLRGGQYKNRVSADQIAARELGKHTRYPCLVLSVDGGVGYKSRVSTLSFDFNGRPIPSEHRHRAIFERYFAGQGDGPTAERRRQLARGRKVVDLLLEDGKALHKKLGKADQHKLGEFLESLDSVEDQVRRNEEWLDVPMKPFDASTLDLDPNPKVDPTAYLRAMYDLIVLGFQVDATRVVTYMTGREDGMGFGDNFPNLALGIKKGHHTISHDGATGHWEEWGRFDQWGATQFAYFLERLSTVTDENGPLLDNTLVLYGSCCSTTHNARNYPLCVAGGRSMGVAHDRYTVHDEDEVPMSNLLVSMLNTVGVPTESFGDSTGELSGFLA